MNLPRFGIEAKHAALFAAALLVDQATKLWAFARFEGVPRNEHISVIGDLWRFQLAFNEGSAFSVRPQDLVPWIPQTLFFALMGLAATVALVWFYKKAAPEDGFSRCGATLILAGAIGNIVDRFRLGKVIDFVDWDFPDVSIGDWALQRWPTFNMADVFVLTGIGLVLLAPFFLGRRKGSAKEG